MTNPIIIFLAKIIVLNVAVTYTKTTLENIKDDMFLDTVEMINKYGYIGEKHQIKTQDGYILEIHRCLPNNNNTKRNMPVFIMHGLAASSFEWIVLGPGKSLVYLLSDDGFDVWMGNARGNIYSKKHVRLNPDNDTRFWQYSWNEIGLYDVPASIDYVLNETNSKKLHYIGHSQGTTSFFVMCSSKPEYNDKIVSTNILAPAVFMSNFDMIGKQLAAFHKPIFSYVIKNQIYEVPSKNPQLNYPLYLICNVHSSLNKLCVQFLKIFGGSFENDKLLNKTLIPLIGSHAPSGLSILQILHYGQGIISGKFRRFDFGANENIKKYGSREPPDYPLDNVKIPIAIHWGANDVLTVPEDIKLLKQALPNVILYRKVPDEGFNHIDFLFANNAKTLLYDKVIDVILKYDNVN